MLGVMRGQPDASTRSPNGALTMRGDRRIRRRSIGSGDRFKETGHASDLATSRA